MRIQRVASGQGVTSGVLESPGWVASKLPPKIVDRAVEGLSWVGIIAAISSVVLISLKHFLQPEFAEAWQHPALRMASLGIVFLSIGFFLVQRTGYLRKGRLLDLGLCFQVTVAFAGALFEAAAYQHPSAVVRVHPPSQRDALAEM